MMTDHPTHPSELKTHTVDATEDVEAAYAPVRRRSQDQQAALAADPALPKPEQLTEAPMLHRVPKRSPFGALLTRTLPEYSGPYQVGVTDIEVVVPEPRTFGTFRHRNIGVNDRGGLLLQTVLCSLFYPADVGGQPPSAPVAWFPNLRQTIDGFVKMANRTPNIWYRMVAYPTAAAAIWGTTFPAHKDPPLLVEEGKKWPLVLFSHGVGCSRLMYSAFCGELASRGYVVAALEHRDGTSPSSLITSSDGTVKRIDWLQWSDLYWPELEEQPTNDTTLRHEQIKMRVAEMTETVRALDKLANGVASPSPKLDFERWKHLDTSETIMTGHSLGGAAAFALAASQEIPLKYIVAFDPAVQRLAPWRGELPHPLLVVNSEEFALGQEWLLFAEQIAGTVKAQRPEVFTIAGATHPAFSDVFLIIPNTVTRMTGMAAHADEVISKAVNVTLDFLRDGNAEAARKRSRKYVKPDAPTVEVKGPVVEEAKQEAMEEAAAKLADDLEKTVAVDALINRPGAVNLKHLMPEPRRRDEVEKPTPKVGDRKAAELVWHDFGE